MSLYGINEDAENLEKCEGGGVRLCNNIDAPFSSLMLPHRENNGHYCIHGLNNTLLKLTSTSMGSTPAFPTLLTPNICMLNAPILSLESSAAASSTDLGARTTVPAAIKPPPRDPSKVSAQNSAPNWISSKPLIFSGCDV